MNDPLVGMIGAVVGITAGGVLDVSAALEDAFAMPAVHRHADATCRCDLKSLADAIQVARSAGRP